MIDPQDALKNLRKADWLKRESVHRVFALLDGHKGKTKAVGGIVRNSLLGISSGDVDMASQFLPEEIIQLAQDSGVKAIPTGIEHGTVTLVVNGESFEITSLRKDIQTDGRHAIVEFGGDWKSDAERRDFTFNALYVSPDGELLDPLGGLDDCLARNVRYIGDAKSRNQEDYLRILRFYRFFAHYGSGRPDADGLKASVAQKSFLSQLSAERVWQEIKKLLAAPDPARALLWMRTSGVLAQILPEGEKWGIDAIHGLIDAEKQFSWPTDPILRLMAIMPPMAEKLATLGKRLRLSNVENDRLQQWALLEQIPADMSDFDVKARLYWGNPDAMASALKLSQAHARQHVDNNIEAIEKSAGYARLLKIATDWQKPLFPVSGKDLLDKGLTAGPALGTKLKELEKRWVQSSFTLSKERLLEFI